MQGTSTLTSQPNWGSPAEDPAIVAAFEQGMVIDHPAAVEKQRDPGPGHEVGAVNVPLLFGPVVD